MMKSAFRCFQIVLLLFGVFGADEDEVKSVSVMEGDPVTLNPDLTQIQEFKRIQWRFGDPVIAQTDGIDISYPNPTKIFRDRLQLDQTGSLTIKNMKTKHAGLYKLQIRHSAGTTNIIFNVTVYESVSDAGKSEMKSVSVMEGDRVTLQTDVTLSGDELIVWRFGDEGEVIAKADIEEAKSSPLYDERFRGRLELDQTGSLTITNTRTTDSGHYTVKISSSKQTVYKRFTVTISDPGLSPAAVVGIGVGVLLCVAAAAAGVIYHRRQISELRKQILKVTVTVTVKEGEDATLKPIKEIKKDDEIQWLFGEGELQASIAKFTGETGEKVEYDDDAADGIFSGRLDLDKTTGSLIIRNSRIAHSGLYTLYIISSGVASEQRFILTVNENVEERSVKEGDAVTLYPGTEIQRYDQIMWMFGYQEDLIAEIRGGTEEIYDDAAGGIFRDKLKLNETTGSLTIRNSRTEHIGPFKLKIISSRGTFYKKFWVFMPLKVTVTVTVKEGDPVTLKPIKEIKKDDVIQWLFGEGELQASIAKFTGETGEKVEYDDDAADGIFSGRLDLDKTTGSLIIRNSRIAHSGLYTLYIISSGVASEQRFILTVNVECEVTVGESVHLSTGLTEIERDDEILWMFEDEIFRIAEIKGGTGETHYVPHERFSDVLQLNDQTGDLTIKNSTAQHEGYYKLKIRSSKGNTNRTYIVIIGDKVSGKPQMKGKNVNKSAVVEMQPLMNK